MAVGLVEPKELLPVKGIRLSAVTAGIKKSGNKDLVLFEIAEGSQSSAVFTKNLFCAAPVTVCKKHLAQKSPRFLMINSGNANAGTGKQGMQDALQCCELLAKETGKTAEEVLPFSTGVIGENLPINKFEKAIPEAVSSLDEDAWLDAGRGIMTTDTLLKGISKQIELDGQIVTITGVSKGAGMIRPNMATMLSFIATDAAVAKNLLDKTIQDVVRTSFNSITIDSDTSTNDACVLIATGQSGAAELKENTEQFQKFYGALKDVFQYLAQAIIRDGEGATKFVAIHVDGASNETDARQIAYTVAHSPLVKTALFASDPNWGRILAAVGRAGVDMDIDKIEIYLDDVCIVRDGGRAASYTEEQGQRVMSQEDITIKINLNAGDSSALIWTSDLSYDYVKINAEYRT